MLTVGEGRLPELMSERGCFYAAQTAYWTLRNRLDAGWESQKNSKFGDDVANENVYRLHQLRPVAPDEMRNYIDSLIRLAQLKRSLGDHESLDRAQISARITEHNLEVDRMQEMRSDITRRLELDSD